MQQISDKFQLRGAAVAPTEAVRPCYRDAPCGSDQKFVSRQVQLVSRGILDVLDNVKFNGDKGTGIGLREMREALHTGGSTLATSSGVSIVFKKVRAEHLIGDGVTAGRRFEKLCCLVKEFELWAHIQSNIDSGETATLRAFFSPTKRTEAQGDSPKALALKEMLKKQGDNTTKWALSHQLAQWRLRLKPQKQKLLLH